MSRALSSLRTLLASVPLSSPSCVSLSTILKGLGLEGKLTADQIAKKWDNLRTKYKVRCGAVTLHSDTGVKTSPEAAAAGGDASVCLH